MFTIAACASAEPVDLATAKAEAQMLSAGETVTLTKAASRKATYARQMSAATQGTSPYYIFSRGANKGFVIISGDDCLPSVLGYTDTGDFDEEKLPPALLNWLDYYAEIIEQAQAAGTNMSRSVSARSVTKASARKDVPVLMTTHWHQSGPYNSKCPFLNSDPTQRALTGCVATAAAQVAYYFHKDNPDTFGASTPTYGYGDAPVTTSVKKGTPIKWDLMLNDYNSSHPAEFDNAIGEFVFATGAATWLTYGTSTGGQINKLVSTFKSLYNLSSEHLNKSKTSSQADWENRLYADLAEGSPMVYAGFKVTNKNDGTEDWAGHAVVVDGYQAQNNLFHFNFGWGGQGDGWFTVDDNTGMNGFNRSMEVTYHVKPLKQNMSASISAPQGFYTFHKNPIRVKIANNGTLPYSGLYLFCSSSSPSVTSLSSAKAKDLSTVIPADGSEVTIELTAKPTLAKAWYVTLTDKNLNILAQEKITASKPSSTLLCHGLAAYTSTDTRTVGDKTYNVAYGNQIIITADITNTSDTPYEDMPRLDIFASTDGGATFENVATKYASSIRIEPGMCGQAQWSASLTPSASTESETLYYAALQNPPSTLTDATVTYENENDTTVRFIMHEATGLNAEIDGKTLRFNGQWDAHQFLTLAKHSSFSSALVYDLTKVEGVGNVPMVEDKPNAIYYVAADSPCQGIANVVKDGYADIIQLTAGYEFVSGEAIKAKKATFNMQANTNAWSLLTVPFDAAVPQGIIAKDITGHTKTGIIGKANAVEELKAGHTYMVMASSEKSQTITAYDVKIASTPAENTDAAIIGTFTQTEAPAGSMLPNDATTQMFSPQTSPVTIEPFRGYFYDEKVTKAFRANSDIINDPGYLALGQSIAAAYKAIDEHNGPEKAIQTLLDSIAKAEAAFTLRPYNNSSITKEHAGRLDEATKVFCEYVAHKNGTVIDMTHMIENPSFENSTYGTTGSLNGWTTEGSNTIVVNATAAANRCVGADGKYAAMSCAPADSTGHGIYQTISGLQSGLYRLQAKVGTSDGRTVTLYANSFETQTGASAFGRYYMHDASIDSIVVKTNEDLIIGIKSGDWYKADDFQLFYLRPLVAEEDPVEIADVNVEKSDIVSISPAEGGINIVTSRPARVSVYTLTGSMAATAIVDRHAFIPLQQGIYIVGEKKIHVK